MVPVKTTSLPYDLDLPAFYRPYHRSLPQKIEAGSSPGTSFETVDQP